MIRADNLLQRYQTVRAHTLALAEPLSAEDCCVQSMTDASPVKWHLAHTSWFFETFVLERCEQPFQPFDAAFRVLFNSYYNTVGDKHPRPRRGLLTRPSLARVLAFRSDVDQRMARLLERVGLPSESIQLIELGLQHEQQHQELIITDVKHLLWCHPLGAVYGLRGEGVAAQRALQWQEFAAGVVEIGHTGDGFCFDNETPRHRVYLAPYRLATRLVTQGEFAEFVADGGYRQSQHWLAEGWDACRAGQRQHPLYWRARGNAWEVFTLQGWQPIERSRAVLHVNYFEADAYARWAKSRLPTEAEWEHAVAGVDATDATFEQLFDTAWQWTASSYVPYPGFRPAPGAVGEYNGKFMVNQYVLRGASCATSPGHGRASYRNFFATSAAWQYSGIRLAQDI